MAQRRAEEALARVIAGEILAPREPKVPYNGAEGVPIREEVLVRHGDTAITRNAYGAHCLNTPNVLFADVDFDTSPSYLWYLTLAAGLLLVSVFIGGYTRMWLVTACIAFGLMHYVPWLARQLHWMVVLAKGGMEAITRVRISTFVASRPNWNVRIYRTPADCRLIATHQPYLATDNEVHAFFAAVRADPVYVQMCIHQQCFRARLTAKPWRIGIADHMRPRPGVWPVRPERLALRNMWVAEYDIRAAEYAVCQYVESIGTSTQHIA